MRIVKHYIVVDFVCCLRVRLLRDCCARYEVFLSCAPLDAAFMQLIRILLSHDVGGIFGSCFSFLK
jgi:hypothetical protein